MDGKYPECEKLAEVSKDSQIIGQFLDEMKYAGKELCTFDDSEEQWMPVRGTIESILAEYFGIDMNKVEEERRAILDDIRSKQ